MAGTMVPVRKTGVPGSTDGTVPRLPHRNDQLFDRFSGFALPIMRRPLWRETAWDFETTFKVSMPKLGVIEDQKAYKLRAELPGLTEKDIEVSLADGMLTLKGEKKQGKEEKAKQYWLSERSSGLFQRTFALPEAVEPETVAAEFAKGVLTITLRRSRRSRRRPKRTG